MIHVQITDDEPYVRNMLKEMVNWQELGMKLVAEAFNGQEALRQINDPALNISLVLTDLKMPVISGLELIEQCRRSSQNVCFIVISAYDDFHLVKEAFMLGATDYLLKSEMTQEQVYHVLKNAAKRLNEGARTKGGQGPQPEKNPDGKSLLKENLLNKIFHEKNNSAAVEQLRQIVSGAKGFRTVVLMLQMTQPASGSEAARTNRERTAKDFFAKSLGVLSNSSGVLCEMISLAPDEWGSLILYPSYESASSIMKQLHYFYDLFAQDQCFVNVGVSHISPNFMALSELIEEARIALDYCFVEGNGSLVRYSSVIDQKTVFSLDIPNQIAELKRLLHSLALKSENLNMNRVIVHPGYVQACNIEEIKELYARYYFVIAEFAEQNGFYHAIEPLCREYENGLRIHADLNGLNRWLADMIQNLKNTAQNNSMTMQIKYYMKNNFGNQDISLQSVADEFGISPSYLSRLFSEKEKVNFSDYLAGLRISKAIELIQTTSMKIYEICEAVGYSNTEHFSRIFKKITGKSPKQYASGNLLKE